MSSGIFVSAFISRFHENLLSAGTKHAFFTISNEKSAEIPFFPMRIGIVGSLSIASGLLVSPVTITLCRRKSTRLLAVIGGLVLTLGCLFTSFAQQYHQVLFSYGKIRKNTKFKESQSYLIQICKNFQRKCTKKVS